MLIKELVEWGAGPRASQALVVGAKARAALHGRLAASVEDVAAVAHIVLRHRIVMSFKAEADGVSADRVIDELLTSVKPG